MISYKVRKMEESNTFIWNLACAYQDTINSSYESYKFTQRDKVIGGKVRPVSHFFVRI